MSTDPQSIATRKKQLREQALARRDALSPDYRQRAAETLAEAPFPVEVPKGAIVAGFFPMKTEISPLPLMRKLAAGGALLALPRIRGRGHPLSMRAWSFGAALVPGQWGIREPAPDAPEVAPDILIVPFAAYDRSGYRVGYGAGYYDRTIATLQAKKKVVTVGFGCVAQEIEACPVEEHDKQLDFIVTEQGIRFNAAAGR